MTERYHLRLALLSAEYPPSPGGVGDYTRRLAAALAGRGHRATVLTVAGGALVAIEVEPDGAGGPPQTVRRGAGWGWSCWGHIPAALRALRPDALHIQYQTGAYGMHPAINLLPGRLRRAGPAVAVTAHDLLPPYLFPKAGPLREWVTRRLLADADAAVVTNADDAERLRGWGLAPALIPIGSNIAPAPPAGYDRAAWRAGLGVGGAETLVVHFGMVGRSKGLEELLGALGRLPADVRLLLVGGDSPAPQDAGYAAEIRRRAASLGGRVLVAGHCPEEQVSAHLLAADVAALPFADGASFRRGSLLAALAHGLPTVTTAPAGASAREEGGLRPPRDGESALLVPPGDEAALAEAIARLAADAGLRARLAAGGRALAAQFGWGAIAERHEQLYRAVLAGRG